MRRLEHVAIALLSAALLALLIVHFRSRREGPREPAATAVNSVPVTPRIPSAVSPPAEAEAGLPEPLTDAEARAKAWQEKRAREERDEERAQFEALLDRARELTKAGGLDGLLWGDSPEQRGDGNDEDLRRLVAEFERETDPERLWALAQRIRFHLTDPRSRIWTVDQDAFERFARQATDASDPVKRQIALGVSAGTGWGDRAAACRDRLLKDPDVRVRAKAAELMPPPKGASASEARPVAERFRELLLDGSSGVRAAAAGGFGGWAYREEDADALAEVARSDPSEAVRLGAARSLAASAAPGARDRLRDLAGDASLPSAVRDAARAGLSGGVVPEGLEEVRVVR